MADTLTGLAPIELAEGIGANNITPASAAPQDLYNQAFDPAAFEEEKKRKQADEAQSLMNAASPTPLGKPVTPPISETLSNLGKVEPAQLGAASIAMDGIQVPQVAAGGTTSVVGNINSKAQAPSATGVGAAPGTSSTDSTKSIMAAYDSQIQSAKSIAKATEAHAVANQAQFANAEAAYAKAEVDRAATKMKFDADFGGKMQQHEQAIADYQQAAGEKVMPGRMLADASTGQRIQAGIFMALSAYGAAISGQENQALKVINNAIDKDIDAQKFNIENKLKGARMGIEGSQYLMSQTRLKFGDDVSATLAAKDAMLAMVQQRISTNSSKFEQATAGPKAQATISEIVKQREQIRMQLQQAQQQQFMLAKIGQGGSSVEDLDPATVAALPKELKETYVKGYGFGTSGAMGAEKFQTKRAEIEPAIENAQRILEFTKNSSKMNPKDRAKLGSELKALSGSLRVPFLGPGQMTPLEFERLMSTIGDPNSFFSLPSLERAKLETVLDKMQGDLQLSAKQYGYKPKYIPKYNK